MTAGGQRTKTQKRTPSRGAASLVAYCGLYCGDCFWHQGGIAELAQRLRSEIKATGFDRFARYITRYPNGKAYNEFPGFRRVLAAMAKKGCTKPCRKGGCDPNCGIRKCCKARKLEGCWQCEKTNVCAGLRELEPIHGAGAMRNLRLIARKGPAGFAAGRRYWATKQAGPLDRNRHNAMLGR